MCDPLTIGGALLTAGGAAANYAASSEVNSARNDVMNAERIRQNQLNQEADAINKGSLGKFDNFGAQQDQRAQSLGDMFTAKPQVTGGTPVPTNAMPTSTSDATNVEVNNKADLAKGFTTQQGKALGQLRSFGDVFGDISRSNAEDAAKVGQIGGFKQGSANVEGLELNNANSAGNGLAFLGDVASGLGKVGVSAGLSGGKLGSMFSAAPKTVAAANAGAFPVGGTTAFNPYLNLYGR